MKLKETVKKYLNPVAIYNDNKATITDEVEHNLEEYNINPDDAETITNELMKIQNRKTPIINDLTNFILEQYGNVSNSKKTDIENLTNTYVDQMRNPTNRKLKKMSKKANSQLTPNSTDDEKTQAFKDVAQFYAIKDHITEAVKPANTVNKYKARARPVGTALTEGAAIIGIPYLILDSLKRGDTSTADAIYQTIANASTNIQTVATTTDNVFVIEEISPDKGSLKIVATNVDDLKTLAYEMNDTTTKVVIEDLSFNEPRVGETASHSTKVTK